MLRGVMHTDLVATYTVLRFAVKMGEDGEYRLVASC